MATIKKANFNKENEEVLINKKELMLQFGVLFINILLQEITQREALKKYA